MKNLLFIVLSFLSFNTFAQEPCATVMPAEQLEWLRNYKTNPFGTLKVSRANNFYYIPVKVHIVGDNNGNGYYRPRFLLNTFCVVNQQYAQVGFHFYIYGEINYINNSALYEHQGGVGSIVGANSDPAAVNMYFVEDPSGACGYYQGFGNAGPFIAIRKSCGGINNSTVAHELGHYFSLPHTFSGWESRSPSANATANDERVNGSNCSFRGDGFCDTPADFLSDRWICPYGGTKTDFNGDAYNPDGSLFMSYANDNCQNKFSPEQIDAMIEYLNDRRAFLLNHPTPDTTIGNFTELLLPGPEAIVPSNYVQLKWNSVFNATHYFVTGTRYTNPNVTSFEFITTDTTAFLDNLTPGFRYRWRVQPFNGANTCAPFSDEYAFTANSPSDLLPGILVDKITCNGKNDGAISFNAIGGTPPYTYFWNNTQTTTAITNLTPGNYAATVYDADNNEISIDVDIVNPASIGISFAQNGSVVTAVPSGGTPPYTYLWNNGVTGTSVSVPGGNYYWVTITDANGCSSFRDSNGATNVAEENKSISALKIYPNPVDANTKINIEFSVPKADNFTVQVLDFSGREVYMDSQENFMGIYKETISMNNLSKGLYLVRIASANESLTRKIMVQ